MHTLRALYDVCKDEGQDQVTATPTKQQARHSASHGYYAGLELTSIPSACECVFNTARLLVSLHYCHEWCLIFTRSKSTLHKPDT